MDQVKENKIGLILGYYTVQLTSDGGSIRHWHPNRMEGWSVKDQLEHNRSIDPNFQMVEIFPNPGTLVAC